MGMNLEPTPAGVRSRRVRSPAWRAYSVKDLPCGPPLLDVHMHTSKPAKSYSR
jgi:hypothetical protein